VAIERDKPYSNSNFLVDLGTGTSEGADAGLVEVVFPQARFHVLEYRTGNDRTIEPTKTLTLLHYGNLILKRGARGSLTWYNWWNDARNGNRAVARNVVVQLLSEDRSAVVLTWKFLRSLPTNYQHSSLSALVAETLVESLELAFERMEME
jgi:phage tail-like protein